MLNWGIGIEHGIVLGSDVAFFDFFLVPVFNFFDLDEAAVIVHGKQICRKFNDHNIIDSSGLYSLIHCTVSIIL